MLQCRVFAYTDTQRYRLGPNYLMLPSTRPSACGFKNNHYDGAMNFTHRARRGSRLLPVPPLAAPPPSFPVPTQPIAGRREKTRIKKENDFVQPGERYRSWAPDRQDRFCKRFADALGHPKVSHELRVIWINFLTQCDQSCGLKVAYRLNVKPSM